MNKQLKKYLDRLHKFDNGIVTSLRSYIESLKNFKIEMKVYFFASKKTDGDYKALKKPRKEYRIVYSDGRTFIDVPACVAKYYSELKSIPITYADKVTENYMLQESR